MKKIVLNLPKDAVGIAGYPYGQEIYKTQVKPLISDVHDKVEIIFPDQVKLVASSFIQGFFSELIQKIGYVALKDNITIISSNAGLVDKIWTNLY
jgi:hypothetical protein